MIIHFSGILHPVRLDTADCRFIDVLSTFTWPDVGDASIPNVNIWGALLNPELAEIIGAYDVIAFGFGPM